MWGPTSADDRGGRRQDPPAGSRRKRVVMTVHTDQLFLQAEIDRRLELYGVGRYDRHHNHRHDGDSVPLAVNPLAAFVARLVGGRTTPAPHRHRSGAAVAPGRPRHP
jgi:hypothetical protein